MEKKIILEINRNLELMKVKSLIVEANPPILPFKEMIHKVLNNIFAIDGRNIKLPELNSLTNKFDIKQMLFDINIPYEDKLKLLSQVMFNNIVSSGLVEDVFEEIVDNLKSKYSKDVDELINSIATSTPPPGFKRSMIEQSITKVLSDNGIPIKPYTIEKIQMLYDFLYIFYKKENFENIKFDNLNDKFYNFLLQELNRKENSYTSLGFKKQPTIDELKNKFPNLKGLFKYKITPELKFKLLKVFTNLTDEEIAKKLNLLLKEYSSDIEGTGFKKILNNYIINQDSPKELLQTITSNQQLFSALNIQDANKLLALIEYFPIFIKEGEIGYKSYRYIDKFINGLKQSIPGIKKLNFAHGLILQNQKRINESATAELSSLFIKCTNELVGVSDPDVILAKYRPQVQRLYKGYFMLVQNNIYDNIINPLNELRTSEAIDPKTINELISGIKSDDSKIGINIYLDFLEESKKSNILGDNGKNIYFELLKSILPSTIKTNEIPKTWIGKFFTFFNKNPYASTLLFGPGVNLKLLTNSILFFKKRFRNPKSSKAVTYIYMYLTYLMMNSFYKVILLGVQPLIGTLFTMSGVYLDRLTQDFIKDVLKRSSYQGFIGDNIENVLYADNSDIQTLKNVFIYEWKKYLSQSFVGFADNQANKSFSKILGQNWYQPLLPPIITNFESGLAFKSFVKFYNYANDKELQTFKATLLDSVKGTWTVLANTNVSEIEKEINATNLANIKELKFTPTDNFIYVPDFKFQNIASITLDDNSILKKVTQHPTAGIKIIGAKASDASKIKIKSKNYPNLTYILKNK